MDNIIDDPMNLLDELNYAMVMAKLPAVEDTAVDTAPELKFETLDEYTPIRRKFKAYAKACRAANKRLVLVIDQDNKLWKFATEGDTIAKLHADQLNVMIRLLPCQLVLCASANNEGWERRNWETRVLHSVDAVPEEYLRATYPRVTDAQWLQLEEAFCRYPLPTINAAKALSTERMRSGEGNAVTVQAIIKKELFQLKDACRIFFARRRDAALYTVNALDRAVDDDPGPHDRRYSFFEGEVLRGVYPLATKALTTMALSVVRPGLTFDDFNRMDLETRVRLAAASLFAPVGTTLEEQILTTAVPSRDEISSLFVGTTTVVIPPPCSQCVDLYIISRRKQSPAVNGDVMSQAGNATIVDAAVLQVTANLHHDASHETFATKRQSFIGGKTMLEALRERGVNGGIDFVYITRKNMDLLQCLSNDLLFSSVPTNIHKLIDNSTQWSPFVPQLKGTPLQLLLERSAGVYVVKHSSVYSTLLQVCLCPDSLALHAQCRKKARQSRKTKEKENATCVPPTDPPSAEAANSRQGSRNGKKKAVSRSSKFSSEHGHMTSPGGRLGVLRTKERTENLG